MSEYISKLKTMNKKSKLIVLLVFLECIFSFLTYKAFQNGVELHNKNEIYKNQFNVKYEVDGSYVDWTGSTFPSSDDYELDLESSSCVSKSGSIVSDVLSYADSKVTVTSNQTLYCTLYFSEKSKIVLPEGLSIGDFVTYDAGSWTAEEIASIQVGPNSSLVSANNSLSKPTSNYQFGGFTVGTSRNSGAVEKFTTDYMYAKMYDNGNSSNQVALSGWRIWDIDEENETITLVSAANPEDYYHGYSTNSVYISQYILAGTKNAVWSEASTAESTYTKRDWSMYENETYGATNARILSYDELANWYNKNLGASISDTLYFRITTFKMIYAEPYLKYQNLIDNHTYYWLGVAEDSTTLRYVYPHGRSVSTSYNGEFGARILVSIPLGNLVGSEDIGDRTVTLDGMKYNYDGHAQYYGPETTQTYNVWELNQMHYAFGNPTTSSPTTPPAGKNVYVALYPGGEKAVCINRNGTQHCFKNNNVEVEQAHVQEVFSDISCTVYPSSVYCNASDFNCGVYSNGRWICNDWGTYDGCNVNSAGNVDCY